MSGHDVSSHISLGTAATDYYFLQSGSERSCTPRSDVDLNNKSLSKSPSMSPKHVSRSRTGSPADRPRNHSYSRSRSTSRSPRRYKERYSYSRSRSYSPRRYKYDKRGRGYRHSRSRSPVPSRRRHNGSRMTSYKTNSRMGRGNPKMSIDNPDPSRVLGVFGLSLYTTERELHHIFSKFGPIEKVMVVLDAQSGRSRGFAFVYFESTSDAKMAKEECTGMEIDGRRIRVDYSVTQRPHTPTPGIYMGKPTESRSGYHRGGYRRSPSPRYRSRRRYDRSRSRSYSPRRKGWGTQAERGMTRNSMQ